MVWYSMVWVIERRYDNMYILRFGLQWSGGQTAMTTKAPAVLKIDDTSNNSGDISLHQNSTNDYITCTILTIPPIPPSLWGKFLSVGAIWRRGNI